MQHDDDLNCATTCRNHSMHLIRSYEAQILKEGYEWPINTASCAWAIEQAILNRPHGQSMMAAGIEYFEGVKFRVQEFNNI